MVTVPTMSYTILVNGNSVALDSTTKVSFKPNFNSISIKHKCTNQSYNLFKVMVNKASEVDFGIDIGTTAVNQPGSMAANTQYIVSFTVNSTIFNQGNGTYRLLLCARGDIDQAWDVTEYFFTVNGLDFVTSDTNNLEVYAQG